MLILFDFDGTLIDMQPRWYELHLDLTKEFSLPVIEKKTYLKAKIDGMHEELLMQSVSDDLETIKAYNKKRIELIEDIKYLAFDQPFEHVFEALEAWQKLGKMVLLSKRKSDENFYWSVEKSGLAPYFQQLISTNGKEKEEVILELFSKEELSNAIIISDAYEDYVMGQKLGMKAVAVSYGCRSAAFFEAKGVTGAVKDCLELKELGIKN